MALDANTLSKLMQATFGIFTVGSKNEFDSYAEGVVMGLKLGTVVITTTGSAGFPGKGTFTGAIQGGPLLMFPLVAVNSFGVLPSLSNGGAPAPLQPLWYLAVSQIATHVLTSLTVDAPLADTVAVGLGTVAPGGFLIDADAIANFIILASLKRGLNITPMRESIASVIGRSTQQMMLLATMPVIPIIGGIVSTPTSPTVGIRSGTIS